MLYEVITDGLLATHHAALQGHAEAGHDRGCSRLGEHARRRCQVGDGGQDLPIGHRDRPTVGLPQVFV